jgi:hypothetical protein
MAEMHSGYTLRRRTGDLHVDEAVHGQTPFAKRSKARAVER